MTRFKSTTILILLIFVSCKNKDCHTFKNQNYSVSISFSSFFDCGEFKKILLNNMTEEDTELRMRFKKYQLYEIDTKDNCSKAKRDTIELKLSISQSDSIYELTNFFIEHYSLDNVITNCGKGVIVKSEVLDGASVKVELCLENRCKSAVFYNYGHLKEVSPDLIKLMGYIESLKTKGK